MTAYKNTYTQMLMYFENKLYFIVFEIAFIKYRNGYSHCFKFPK